MLRVVIFFVGALLCIPAFSWAGDSAQPLLNHVEEVTSGQVEILDTRMRTPSSLAVNSKFQLKTLGTERSLEVTERRKHSNGSISVKAVSSNSPGDVVIITQYGSVTMARLKIEGKSWTYVQYPDASFRYPSELLPTRFDDDALESKREESGGQIVSGDGSPLPAGEMVTIDIYATYTQPGIDLYGQDGVVTRIAHLVDVTNQIYQDSGVFIEANLLAAEFVNYDSNNEKTSSEAHGALYDGDEFAAARFDIEGRGADFSVLFRPFVEDDDACGIAWMGGWPDEQPRFSPHMMVSHVSLDCSDNILAHELGHNMGLRHSQRQTGYGGSYPYARGYGVDDEFVTVMAYSSEFDYAKEVYLFSSPELDCDGNPCGIDHTEPAGADSVRALNNLRHLMPDIRSRNDSVEGIASLVTTFGGGYIESDHAGLECKPASRCGGFMPKESTITLTAVPVPGESFKGWGGSCLASSDTPTCEVTIDGLVNISAEFTNTKLEGTKLNKQRLYQSLEEANESNTVWLQDNLHLGTTGFSWKSVGGLRGPDNLVIHSGYSEEIFYSHKGSWILEKTIYLRSFAGAGVISFWAKFESAEGDSARLFIGDYYGEPDLTIRNDGEWHYYEVPVEELDTQRMSRGLSFSYVSNSDKGKGFNALLLDDIQFARAEENPIKVVTTATSGSGTVSLISESALSSSVECVVDCIQFVKQGEEIQLQAAPDKGKEFLRWSGACEGTDLHCTLIVEDDTKIEAVFSDNSAEISQDFSQWLDNDDLLFRLATSSQANERWGASEDTKSGKGVSAKLSFMEAAPASTVLYTEVEGPGSLSFDWKASIDDDIYDYHGSMRLFINDELVTEIYSNSPWETENISLGEGTHFIEWRIQSGWGNSTFPGDVFIDNVQWTGATSKSTAQLTLNSSKGGVVIADGGISCSSKCASLIGTGVITLSAQPDENFTFSHWEGACSGSESPCELDVQKNESVKAIFEEYLGYAIRTNVTGEGLLSPATLYLKEGESGKLVVAPKAGYYLNSISGCNGALSGNEYHVGPIESDCQVEAEFNRYRYEVNFDLGEHGSHSGGGTLSQTILHGDAAEAPVLSVENGWHFAGWNGLFDNVTSNLNIEAVYQRLEGSVRVNLSLSEGGGTPLSLVQYVPAGHSLNIPLVADKNYKIGKYVGGNCPEGKWVEPQEYRLGAIERSCSVSFNFTKVAVKPSSILMLIMATEAKKEKL